MALAAVLLEEALEDAKKYILSDIGKKWRDFRTKLWTKYVMKKEDMPMPLVRSAVLAAMPPHIPETTWAQFCDYKMREDVLEIAERNRACRATYTSPHTGGSKKLLVRGLEIAEKTGIAPSRGELYAETHTKKDGSYTDEQVPQIKALENVPRVPR
ncbi:hypothetical protein LINGRAHAP2_LOCUS29273, partial [Linum grandiflorum]